ncbi:GNAT family N-acetyltransferase [Nocardioides sp. CER19]|uniref:GNAT family N-acetyltransferase n=1 Tax=Nocardioides sp. CER19 TaxID=3038538 RepID=UPI00244B87C3|nr:GNAT family N-acetyltransferase [Nocardioides sp. CER19]MDH2413685.1 GNAT family N-acetyltransferase [Nocardioides sp. CER19]
MTIRPAEVSDAEALAPLHVQVWDEAYTGLMPQRVLDDRQARPMQEKVERWRERIAWPHGATWVADDDGGLVGFVSIGRGRDGSGDLEVMALYVRRAHYGTGLGHRLLDTAIGDRPAYLWVLDGNARAIGFYERHGFAFDGQVEEEPEGLHRRMVRG